MVSSVRAQKAPKYGGWPPASCYSCAEVYFSHTTSRQIEVMPPLLVHCLWYLSSAVLQPPILTRCPLSWLWILVFVSQARSLSKDRR